MWFTPDELLDGQRRQRSKWRPFAIEISRPVSSDALSLQTLGDLVSDVLVEVSVDVHGDTNARVAEVFAHESRVSSGGDE